MLVCQGGRRREKDKDKEKKGGREDGREIYIDVKIIIGLIQILKSL